MSSKAVLAENRPPREPEHLREAMQMYRYGLSGLPKAYVEYHRDLAFKEAKRLEDLFGFVVVDRRMENDGWCDSMECLIITVITKNGNARRLKWHDGNRGFMKKCESGGWSIIFEEDLH